MTRESCNLDKDEAEILEPSPSSSSSPSPPPLPPPSLYLKLSEELPTPERPGNPGAAHSGAAISQERKPNEGPQPPVRFINRCSSCRKRVGLTGFRCRCGDLFCARHRYSDAHHCSFDYKAAGREQIAKANPFIRPAKIIKI